MAKSKTQSKPVKASAVTKSAPAVKAKASVGKEVSKKVDKKAKKVESSDEESDDDSESSASEDSSASDDESVEEKKKPVANGKASDKAKAKVEVDSDDSEDSESDESDAKPVTNGKAKAKAADTKKAAAAASSDEDASSDDDDEEDDDKESDDSEDSDESEEEEAEEEKPVSKKRKAEEVATPQAKKQKAETNGNETKNLFVGSLSWNVDDGYLRSEFEKFGEIIRANVVTDRDSGRSKGFGYVEFTNLEDAIKAHAEMTGAEIDGRAINVDFSQPRGDNANNGQRQQDRAKSYGDQPSEPSDTLFVGNLSFEADESVVGEAFAGYEGLKHIRLPTRPEDGTPKGFGYVQFNSVEEATAAHDGMAGAYISGRPIRLDYSQPRQNTGDSPRGGFGDRGGRGRGRGRGGFGDRGGRGRGRGGFGDRGGRGGGRGGSTNRGGFGSFQGKKMTF